MQLHHTHAGHTSVGTVLAFGTLLISNDLHVQFPAYFDHLFFEALDYIADAQNRHHVSML